MEYLHPLAVQGLEFLPYRLRQDDVGGDSLYRIGADDLVVLSDGNTMRLHVGLSAFRRCQFSGDEANLFGNRDEAYFFIG